MDTGERIEVKNNRNQSSPAVVAPFPISFTQTGCVALELLFMIRLESYCSNHMKSSCTEVNYDCLY
jgi:hypothetical protein